MRPMSMKPRPVVFAILLVAVFMCGWPQSSAAGAPNPGGTQVASPAPAPQAQAASLDELRRLLAEQQRLIDSQAQRLDRLEAELQRTRTEIAAAAQPQGVAPPAAAIEARLAAIEQRVSRQPEMLSDVSADFPGAFHIPGTNAAIKFGGQVKLAGIHTFNAIGTDDRFVTSSIPVGSDRPPGQEARVVYTAIPSRFSFDVRGPMGSTRRYRTFVEGDFAGPNRVFRLRHAFVQTTRFVFGQTWSTFSDPEAEPIGVDFEGLNAISLFRQAQVRYTHPLRNGLAFAVAAENPAPDLTDAHRTATNEGGYASIQGSASTSTGREASGDFVAGRNAYGQPAYAGTVNTKYNGNYATAGARNPYGGWTTATAGPYGGKVTTTLPSGYRTTTYYGRSYYTYGGAYYRPYSYGGVHYYYPVPPPYYAYYQTPPVGWTIVVMASVKYLVSSDGSYAKETTSSDGKMVYQSVPAPQGAKLQALPAERVLVTVSGTTYYVCSNTFYRRVVEGAQEHFVVVTAPAGVVFVAALPADFTVVQANTMYFLAGGRYYVPFLASDGKEMYVMVDQPPQPPASTAPAAAPAAAKPPAAPVTTPATAKAPASSAATPTSTPPAQATAVRTVSSSFSVPAGTLIVVRLSAELSSAAASAGDRVRGFLDQDLSTNGRLVMTHGSTVYGIVTAVDRAKKKLTATLTDIKVGDKILSIKTQPLDAPGGVIRAQSPQAFTVVVPFQIDIVTNVAVR